MNPCPCGYLTDPVRACRCGTVDIERYQAKVSGPLLDRIDLHVEVPAVTPEEMHETGPAESSAQIRERVVAARARQLARFTGTPVRTNAQMSHKMLATHCPLSASAKTLLRAAMKELHLSARAHDKILRIARTITDLDHRDTLTEADLAEAVQYRTLDRRMGA